MAAGADIPTVVDDLKVRQAEVDALRTELTDLSRRCEMAKAQTLDIEAVAQGYAKLPLLLDEAERIGAGLELHTFLRQVIDVIEWKQSPTNPKEGTAEIQLFELPGFWSAEEGEATHRTAVARFGESSLLAPREGLEPPT